MCSLHSAELRSARKNKNLHLCLSLIPASFPTSLWSGLNLYRSSSTSLRNSELLRLTTKTHSRAKASQCCPQPRGSLEVTCILLRALKIQQTYEQPLGYSLFGSRKISARDNWGQNNGGPWCATVPLILF